MPTFASYFPFCVNKYKSVIKPAPRGSKHTSTITHLGTKHYIIISFYINSLSVFPLCWGYALKKVPLDKNKYILGMKQR